MPQPYIMSDSVRQRIEQRQGKLHAHAVIDAKHAALLVVDMQNYFVAERQPAEVPEARFIVSNINRMARTMRQSGGHVVWIQTTSSGAMERWANHHRHTLSSERSQGRLVGLSEGSEGFALYPALETHPGDLYVKKIMYSAFIDGSSNVEAVLRSRRIESLLISGTATNVCCESTARDAMMRDFRVIMLADATAAATVQEHVSALDNIALFFGDVMTVDEASARLRPS